MIRAMTRLSDRVLDRLLRTDRATAQCGPLPGPYKQCHWIDPENCLWCCTQYDGTLLCNG